MIAERFLFTVYPIILYVYPRTNDIIVRTQRRGIRNNIAAPEYWGGKIIWKVSASIILVLFNTRMAQLKI